MQFVYILVPGCEVPRISLIFNIMQVTKSAMLLSQVTKKTLHVAVSNYLLIFQPCLWHSAYWFSVRHGVLIWCSPLLVYQVQSSLPSAGDPFAEH